LAGAATAAHFIQSTKQVEVKVDGLGTAGFKVA
jgi:hypothetical protein